MNAHLFFYTRIKNVDYQAIISPPEDICPKSARKMFLTQARGIINVEQYDDPLTEPRWLYSKIDNLLLWGVGILNKELNDDVFKDFAGRPVRGFFGIIIDVTKQDPTLPFDLNFFKQLYSSYIIPIWELEFDAFKKSSVTADFDIDLFTCISKQSSQISLNTDSNRTNLLGNVIPTDAFSAALSMPDSTSIVTGFSSKAHAYAHEYLYLNAIVAGVDNPEFRIHKKPTPPTPPIVHPSQPKKACRLSLILGAILVLAILLMIINKGCNNHSSKGVPKELASGVQTDSIQSKK